MYGIPLIGQAADSLGDLAPWANLTATVVMTLVFVWILTKRDPKDRELTRLELAAARDDYQESLKSVLVELAAERHSREITNDKFMAMITENRERSHEQRIEDRKVYQDSTRAMLQEFLSAVKEIKRNGHTG